MKKYISNIFTEIVNKRIESDILFESEHTMVIVDKFKKNNTHWLVLPKKNYVDLTHFLNEATNIEILDFFDTMKFFLNKLSHCNVIFNIGKESNQAIFHMHAHIMSSLKLDS